MSNRLLGINSRLLYQSSDVTVRENKDFETQLSNSTNHYQSRFVFTCIACVVLFFVSTTY